MGPKHRPRRLGAVQRRSTTHRRIMIVGDDDHPFERLVKFCRGIFKCALFSLFISHGCEYMDVSIRHLTGVFGLSEHMAGVIVHVLVIMSLRFIELPDEWARNFVGFFFQAC